MLLSLINNTYTYSRHRGLRLHCNSRCAIISSRYDMVGIWTFHPPAQTVPPDNFPSFLHGGGHFSPSTTTTCQSTI